MSVTQADSLALLYKGLHRHPERTEAKRARTGYQMWSVHGGQKRGLCGHWEPPQLHLPFLLWQAQIESQFAKTAYTPLKRVNYRQSSALSRCGGSGLLRVVAATAFSMLSSAAAAHSPAAQEAEGRLAGKSGKPGKTWPEPGPLLPSHGLSAWCACASACMCVRVHAFAI